MANEYIHDLDVIGAVDDGSLLAIEDTASPTDLKKVTAANFQAYLTINASQMTGTLAVTEGGTGNASLTADRVLLSHLNTPTAPIAVSTITRTELETLNDVSGNIQDQIDGILDGCTFTGNVGIGVAPSVPLHVGSDSDCSVYFDEAVDAAGGADFKLRKARNTMASPNVVLASDYLGSISWHGYDGSSYDYGAGIRTLVTAIAAGNLSTSLEFRTVNAGSVATNMTLNKDGDLTILGDLTLSGGDISAGVDLTTQGVLKLYGDNAGGGGASYWYNGDNDDGTVEYWKMIPTGIGAVNAINFGPNTDFNAFIFGNDGDLTIAGNFVSGGHAHIKGPTVAGDGWIRAGEDLSKRGKLTLYGNDANNCGFLVLHNSANKDTNVEYWGFVGNGDNAYIGPNTDTDAFIFNRLGNLTIAGDLTVSGGDAYIGIDNTTQGILKLYGDNASGNAKLYLYNSVNNHGTEDYWIMQADGVSFWIGAVSDPNEFIFGNTGDLTMGGDLTAVDGIFSGDLYINGGDIYGPTGADIYIRARNNQDVWIVDDSGEGLKVADGGSIVISSGNISLAALATVDGRDLNVDGIKLDGIDSNANNFVHPGGITNSFEADGQVWEITNGHITGVHAP